MATKPQFVRMDDHVAALAEKDAELAALRSRIEELADYWNDAAAVAFPGHAVAHLESSADALLALLNPEGEDR